MLFSVGVICWCCTTAVAAVEYALKNYDTDDGDHTDDVSPYAWVDKCQAAGNGEHAQQGIEVSEYITLESH